MFAGSINGKILFMEVASRLYLSSTIGIAQHGNDYPKQGIRNLINKICSLRHYVWLVEFH